MTKKICFSIYRVTTFLAEIFFPGGTQPKWKINEILEGRGFDKHLLEWKFQGRGGSKTKAPSVERLWIFSGTAQFKSIAS